MCEGHDEFRRLSPGMDESELDELLRLHRETRRPAVPANLSQNVWREIRRRQALAAESGRWLEWLLEPFLRPVMLAPALVLALMLGAGVGALTAYAQPSPARAALDLEVFSAASPSLPSTLLHASL